MAIGPLGSPAVASHVSCRALVEPPSRHSSVSPHSLALKCHLSAVSQDLALLHARLLPQPQLSPEQAKGVMIPYTGLLPPPLQGSDARFSAPYPTGKITDLQAHQGEMGTEQGRDSSTTPAHCSIRSHPSSGLQICWTKAKALLCLSNC